MSNPNGGVQTPPVAAPRLQKPVKRKERTTAKHKPLQQQEQEKLRHKELEQQNKLHQEDETARIPSAKKPKKGCSSCCFSSCCCPDGGGASKDCDSIIDADDDATHIASLSNHSSRDKSSGCCGCCCWKNKKRATKGEFQKTSSSSGPRKSRCKHCCRKLAAFIFSHIGLCSLVVGYSIMGGFLFQYLEATDEMKERINVLNTRSYSVMKLWNMTNDLNILYKENWTAMAEVILLEFQNNVYRSVKERGWDGRDETDEDMQWSFSGSLLYSVTVITTIGYGHIAPKTNNGRLVTMFYALIGIPLTLLCISNIGSFFANCFRLLYKYICSCLDCLFCPKRQKVTKKSGSTSTMTTTSSLKSVASKKSKSVKELNLEHDESRQALRRDISVVEGGLRDTPQSSKDSLRPHGHEEAVTITKPADDQSSRKLSLTEEVRVPMCVSLIIVGLYIFGGAVLFSLWEKDWSYLIGSYFCFITLSTIGFGDYVFGVGSDLDNSEKMITCAIYLVLGLSIIAMCFDLMQEEVRAKCRWLGVKLGIVDPSKKRRRR
ncbi:TWiK family of potassium channels protein 18-like [Biomphalaria glabrata]|uniref:TWiK family of potassium channels protein 18-like n=1 Tax=Biomphalaria glabrata TaxID=6526 RepID=A0A9U8EDR9_BIOGL|nr:TWiK family of potassium channels protein 18-like [Biomphalaria glabrata]XP_013083306.2 TWiK family of potassium channels protein 18-like [Biomphalaria glabrata]